MFTALHTAEVAVGDTQDTNEVSYPGYSRVAYAPGQTVFPKCTEAQPIDNGTYITHYSVAGIDGVITHVGNLSPATLLQGNANPIFDVEDING